MSLQLADDVCGQDNDILLHDPLSGIKGATGNAAPKFPISILFSITT
jgi:hypothetical protein